MVSSARYARIKTVGYKCAIFTVALFIIAVAQVTFFSKINLFGAPPDLLLAALVVICIKNDHTVASVCGIVSGFFYCSLGGDRYYLYLAFSFLCGYVLWIVAEHFFGKNYPAFLALATIAFGIKGAYNFLYSAMVGSSFTFFRTFGAIILPEFASSMVFCSLSYLIFSILSNLVNKNKKVIKEAR